MTPKNIRTIQTALRNQDLVPFHSFPNRYPHLYVYLSDDEQITARIQDPPGNAYAWDRRECWIDVHLDADAIDWKTAYRKRGFAWDDDREEWKPNYLARKNGWQTTEDVDTLICKRASAKHVKENLPIWIERIDAYFNDGENQ